MFIGNTHHLQSLMIVLYVLILEYILAEIQTLQNTCPFDVSGHPALTINAGFSDGLPVGMMIVGKRFDEETVLKVAYTWEKILEQ